MAAELKDKLEVTNQTPIPKTERDWVELALRTGPKALKNAFRHEALFRHTTTKEMLELLAKIQELAKDTDTEKKKSEIIAQARRDLELIKQLNSKLSAKSKEYADATYSLKTNKMEAVLEGAIAFMEAHFFDLCDGIIPDKFNFLSNKTTVLGNKEGAKGNSRETFIKAALLLIYANLSKVSLKTMPPAEKKEWIDTTSLAHVTPLPKGMNLATELPSFNECTFHYDHGLAFVHSGYAFGGHRFEQRYPKGKKFGPEDCSSSMALLTGCKAAVSTHDMLYSYRQKTKEGYVDPAWLGGKECNALDELFDPVIVKDPARDIKPGDLYCYRRFKESDYKMGTGGHTAMVVGFIEGSVLTIGYNRDMPTMEGCGLQSFKYGNDQNPKNMVFRSKK